MRQRTILDSCALRTLTHSAAECFQECRVKWDYRYNRGIVTTEPQAALDFGSAIHTGLEFWFKYGVAKGAVEAGVAKGAKLGLSNENLCKVQVLLEEYIKKYAEESFEVVKVEEVFTAKLRNPKTGKYSKTFMLQGKVDGLVKQDDKYYILEHKTTSDITEAYINAIGIKSQTVLYAVALEAQGYPIKGAIYDIIEKPGIKMATEESEEEFERRKAALLAKNKSGKTNAKRREAETVDDFMARLRERVTEDSFKRVVIEFGIEKKRDAMVNLWRTAKDMISPSIYPTTGACVKFGNVCPYLNLCRAGGKIEACGEEYTHRQANEELVEVEKC